MPTRRAALLAIFGAALAVALGSGDASAQRRRSGSFGFHAPRSHHYHGSSSSSGGHTPCDPSDRVCLEHERRARAAFGRDFVMPMLPALFGGILVIAGVTFWMSRRKKSPASLVVDDLELDLIAIDIALDPGAASALRGEIDRLLAVSSILTRCLPELASALSASRASWTHLAVRSWPVATTDEALQRFQAVVREAEERGRASAMPPDGPASYRDRPSPRVASPPAVLLSLMVLTRREISEVAGQPVEIALHAIESLRALGPDDIISAELTWVPSDAEPTTTAELTALHPRLRAV